MKSSLEQKGKKLRLMLLGDGPLRKQIERRIQNLGITSHVIMPGNVSDIENYYSAMDILLFPSWHEGLSGSLVEAQACKVLPVASKIPENLEALYEGLHKFTFELSNPDQALKQLTSAINYVQGSNKKIIEKASDYVMNKFNIQKHCQEMLAFYNDLLDVP